MVSCTECDFLAIIDQHPKLCAWGWWDPQQGRLMKLELESNRNSPKSCFDEFRRSVEWLAKCRTTKTATSESPNSYNLKHRAEKATGDYICNGALIAAAIFLNIQVKTFSGTPNPGIGISKRCPNYLATPST